MSNTGMPEGDQISDLILRMVHLHHQRQIGLLSHLPFWSV